MNNSSKFSLMFMLCIKIYLTKSKESALLKLTSLLQSRSHPSDLVNLCLFYRYLHAIYFLLLHYNDFWWNTCHLDFIIFLLVDVTITFVLILTSRALLASEILARLVALLSLTIFKKITSIVISSNPFLLLSLSTL